MAIKTSTDIENVIMDLSSFVYSKAKSPKEEHLNWVERSKRYDENRQLLAICRTATQYLEMASARLSDVTSELSIPLRIYIEGCKVPTDCTVSCEEPMCTLKDVIWRTSRRLHGQQGEVPPAFSLVWGNGEPVEICEHPLQSFGGFLSQKAQGDIIEKAQLSGERLILGLGVPSGVEPSSWNS